MLIRSKINEPATTWQEKGDRAWFLIQHSQPGLLFGDDGTAEAQRERWRLATSPLSTGQAL
jgi:hypothetical protein